MMKRHTKILLSATAALAFACLPALNAYTPKSAVTASAATVSSKFTGYTKASDVDYVYTTYNNKQVTVNWGARGEDCTFLTSKALNFYTGNNTFEVFSQKSGSTSTSSVPSSELYKALQAFMKSKHNYTNGYKENNNLLKYTDCVLSGYTQGISSFYSGVAIGPNWDNQSPGWNKEHTWPNSKGLGGSDEDDVMMIRPTATSENSSRGNTAYGESSGYYNPNNESGGKLNLHGDCARIVLYTYTRWGNSSYMWGSSGVIENLNVLLKWMQEDPVDTWEMGRNDAVQSITGTRNVFVDYPELAWLMFGKSAPTGMNTPSGIANGGEIVPPVVNPDDSTGGDETPDDTTPDLPAANSTVSIADAVKIGSAMAHNTTTSDKYYITGKISNVSNTQYGNMTIEDDNGNSIYVYGTYSADGSTRYDALTTKPVAGNTVTLYSVIGNYNGAQLKNAWITSINNSSSGDSTDSDSSSSNPGSTPVDPTPDDPTPDVSVPAGTLATFTFGDNKSSGHYDNGTASTSKSYNDNGYTLELTSASQMYADCYDAKGNSCIKLGSSKNVGSFTFCVPSDVTEVTLEIAKYKANASIIKINGVEYSLNGASDNGEYDEITIDTSSNKTVVVETTSGGKRAMINTIYFLGGATETPDDSTSSDSTPEVSVPGDSTPDDSTPDDSTSSDSTPDVSVPGDSTPDDSTPESSVPGDSTDDDSTDNDSTTDGSSSDTTQDTTSDDQAQDMLAGVMGCTSFVGGTTLATLLLAGCVVVLKKKEN